MIFQLLFPYIIPTECDSVVVCAIERRTIEAGHGDCEVVDDRYGGGEEGGQRISNHSQSR